MLEHPSARLAHRSRAPMLVIMGHHSRTEALRLARMFKRRGQRPQPELRRIRLRQGTRMGTHFFKSPQLSGVSQNLEARAIGAGTYAARGAAVGAQKDIGAAQGINKAAYQGVPKRTAAYAPGPKKT